MLNIYISSANKKEGKTFISAGLSATMQSLGYATSVYKPVQTNGIELNGFMQSPDLTMIKTIDPYINTYFSYLFKSDLTPLVASEKENKIIDLDKIFSDYNKILTNSDCTIIDGNNGLLSPLAPSVQNIDLIKKLQIPVLFIVTPEKNSVDDILSTLYVALNNGIQTRGVIINDIKENCSKDVLTSFTRIIEEYSGINILGLMPYLGSKIEPEDLITGILNGIDIESVFNVKIEKLDFN